MSLADDEPSGTGDDVTVDGQRRTTTTTTFCLADMWARWWRVLEPASDGSVAGSDADSDGSATVNDTTAAGDEQALMHPDMAVMTVARTVNATQ